jgi:hypothetical protein
MILKPQLYSAFEKDSEGKPRAIMFCNILPNVHIHRVYSKYRVNYSYTLTLGWLFWNVGFTLLRKNKRYEKRSK